MAPEPPLLHIEELHAHYGPSHVLQGVTLDVPAGQVTAVLGRNGVGKTTLINAVMGLVPATGGQIVMDGADLTRLPAARRRGHRMALVPQGRRVFKSLTVEEHLSLVKPAPDSIFTQDWLFETFPRLHERRGAVARTLSGGEQSMLAIARALTADPRLLLMDESTEGLAPLLIETVRGIVDLLRAHGVTVLLVEQNLQFALTCADRVAIMQRGAVDRVYEREAIPDMPTLSDLILGHGG